MPNIGRAYIAFYDLFAGRYVRWPKISFFLICSFAEDPWERKALPEAVFTEMLLGVLLAPMAFSNLRAPIRSSISITDASEQGCAAGEASEFDVCITQDG